jgi:hypothetical protein
MSHPTEYLLRITRTGPEDAPFGWQILRQQDSKEIAHSTKTFATRLEALADSTRVAATLALDGAIDPDPSGSC